MRRRLRAQRRDCWPIGCEFTSGWCRHGEPSISFAILGCGLAAIAEDAQQHQEQIDEIEIEPQRTHHRLATGNAAIIIDVVHLLDALRIVRREPNEYDHTDYRYRPVRELLVNTWPQVDKS
jgi:hypothetical protein